MLDPGPNLGKPQNQSVENARAESERVICDCIEDVLAKTKTKPQEVDILIINCSLFSPTPSLCALAAHKFGMRKDILSYVARGSQPKREGRGGQRGQGR